MLQPQTSLDTVICGPFCCMIDRNREAQTCSRCLLLHWPRASKVRVLAECMCCGSKDMHPGTLVVDFANRHVGGGCWGGGFVQDPPRLFVDQLSQVSGALNSHNAIHPKRRCILDLTAPSLEQADLGLYFKDTNSKMKCCTQGRGGRTK